MAVVHLLSGSDIAGPRISRVIKPGIIRQPGHTGSACAFDLLWKQFAGDGLDDLQSADLRPVRRCAVSHIFAVMAGEPPVEGNGPVGCEGVYVDQRTVLPAEALADIDDRLVLVPLAPLIKVIMTANFGGFTPANVNNLPKAPANFVPTATSSKT